MNYRASRLMKIAKKLYAQGRFSESKEAQRLSKIASMDEDDPNHPDNLRYLKYVEDINADKELLPEDKRVLKLMYTRLNPGEIFDPKFLDAFVEFASNYATKYPNEKITRKQEADFYRKFYNPYREQEDDEDYHSYRMVSGGPIQGEED